MASKQCARPDCKKKAIGDNYCSTYCIRHVRGILVSSGYQKNEPGVLNKTQLREQRRQRKTTKQREARARR